MADWPLATASAPAPQDSHQTDGRGTILVVEDEPVVQRVVTSILQRTGFEVILAQDGARALEILRAGPGAVDLVLMDMTMPGMTAEEVVAGIRALNPDLPIMLNSGNAPGAVVKRMLDEGAVQGFLAKPFQLRQLREGISGLLRASADRDGASGPS